MSRFKEKADSSISGRPRSAKVAMLLALTLLMVQPSLAIDPAVTKAFAEAEKYAKQQRSYAPGEEKLEDKQCHEDIKHLQEITGRLTPPQLLELTLLSRKKMTEEFRHPEAYLTYFESVIHFSMRRLGRLKTSEAVKALDDIWDMIHPDASMALVWHEAKENQTRLLQSELNAKQRKLMQSHVK